MTSLRDIWRAQISIEDYERHMAAAGQAEANASLLAELFRDRPPRLGATILFAGAGTGQCFDYLAPSVLRRYRTTFADINPAFLSRLSERLLEIDFFTVVDDIERSRLRGLFDLAIAVLVLEHVDWRKAVACLSRQARRIFVVLQQDPSEPAPCRLEGSMSLLKEARPVLIDPEELTRALTALGFDLSATSQRRVADDKTMLGLDFGARAVRPADQR